MNIHKNARLTYLRRLEMVQDITERGVSASDAGLLDKSSRPEKAPRSIEPHLALAIVELRLKLYLYKAFAVTRRFARR